MLSNGSEHVRNVVQYGIKIAVFSKKLQKIAQRLLKSLAAATDPRLWYVWVTTLAFSTGLKSYIFALFNYYFKPSLFTKSWLSANKQRFQIFPPTIYLSDKKFLFWKFLITSLHVICNLSPQSKILATPINWRWPEKLFWRPFLFFYLEITCGYVLGSWPQAILSLASKELSLALDFFVSLASTPTLFATETATVVWKLSQCEILIPRCRLSKKLSKSYCVITRITACTHGAPCSHASIPKTEKLL